VSDTWITIAALTVGTLVTKAVAPVAFGARRPTERTLRVTALVAPAILAALVVYETLGGKDGISLDARAAGLAAAMLALAARAPMLVVILLAAAVTALVRALT
jgi:hypothetical protein